tara:strand:- start:191 stop:460 length:270 start_codon:yes stop_codon:yes gene_type:complete
MLNHRDNDITETNAVEQPDGSYIDEFGDILRYNKVGQRHGEFGPAIIYDEGDYSAEWYFHGRSCSFDEWLKLSTISDEQKMMLRLQYDW